ncbi:MAG: CoA-binding protein [Spirochaetes bacterium]|nr:CoA-binding protein [Spirochaetota bacterium]
MDQCEVPAFNSEDGEIKEILTRYKVVAIVGLSDDPTKDSNRVAQYLISNGYTVVPVNPTKETILGLKSYPNLTSIPFTVDIVDIFRKPADVPPVVDEAIAIGAKVVWMQLGIAHNEAAKKAREAGLKVVQSKCIKMEHSRYFGTDAHAVTFNISPGQ